MQSTILRHANYFHSLILLHDQHLVSQIGFVGSNFLTSVAPLCHACHVATIPRVLLCNKTSKTPKPCESHGVENPGNFSLSPIGLLL